jgi:hypothetical protein
VAGAGAVPVGPATRSRVVDALFSGTHEPGTEVINSFATENAGFYKG